MDFDFYFGENKREISFNSGGGDVRIDEWKGRRGIEEGRRKTRGERLRVRSVKNGDANSVPMCLYRGERDAIFTGVRWMEERTGYSSDSTNKWHDDCDASRIIFSLSLSLHPPTNRRLRSIGNVDSRWQ